MTWRAASVLAIVIALAVQLGFMQGSWFFLDDVRNFAEARSGLSWQFLTRPIGEHMTIGHRLLDWLVAVPFARHWWAAVLITLIWSAIALGYLAATLRELFGSHPRLAVVVLLAGTAWPLTGTGQWFAGGALAIPVFAAMSGATYHHLHWRTTGSRGALAMSLLWAVTGLAFSVQGVFLAPMLLTVALVRLPPRALRSWPRLRSEALAVMPVAALGLALALYERTQPWAPDTTVPPLSQVLDLLRVIVIRGVLPSLLGIGMDGGVPDPSRETTMQILAALVLVALLVVAVVHGRRWIAGIALFTVGTLVTATAIAVARLSELSPTVAGTEPRYLLPAVLLGSIGLAALLAPRPQTGDLRRAGVPPLVVTLGLGIVAIVYAVNLVHTRDTRRVALNFAEAAKRTTHQLERSLATSRRDATGDSIVDAPLPFPLFYQNDPENSLTNFGRFFAADGLEAPGVPSDGQLLLVSTDGRLQPVRFRPEARPVACQPGQPCLITLPTVTTPLFLRTTTATGEYVIPVSPGATGSVSPRPPAAGRNGRTSSITPGTLIPTRPPAIGAP